MTPDVLAGVGEVQPSASPTISRQHEMPGAPDALGGVSLDAVESVVQRMLRSLHAPHKASGGEIGTGTHGIEGQDSVDIVAEPKEFIVNARDAQKPENNAILRAMNSGHDVTPTRMANGGLVEQAAAMPKKMAAWMQDRYGASGTAAAMGFGQAATWGASAGLSAMTGMPIMLPPGTGMLTALAAAEIRHRLKSPETLERERTEQAQTQQARHADTQRFASLPQYDAYPHMHFGGEIPGFAKPTSGAYADEKGWQQRRFHDGGEVPQSDGPHPSRAIPLSEPKAFRHGQGNRMQGVYGQRFRTNLVGPQPVNPTVKNYTAIAEVENWTEPTPTRNTPDRDLPEPQPAQSTLNHDVMHAAQQAGLNLGFNDYSQLLRRIRDGQSTATTDAERNQVMQAEISRLAASTPAIPTSGASVDVQQSNVERENVQRNQAVLKNLDAMNFRHPEPQVDVPIARHAADVPETAMPMVPTARHAGPMPTRQPTTEAKDAPQQGMFGRFIDRLGDAQRPLEDFLGFNDQPSPFYQAHAQREQERQSSRWQRGSDTRRNASIPESGGTVGGAGNAELLAAIKELTKAVEELAKKASQTPPQEQKFGVDEQGNFRPRGFGQTATHGGASGLHPDTRTPIKEGGTDQGAELIRRMAMLRS